ncbi:aspartate/glutamate racemase family protein [Poseidonocella sp. HB161398]|uniref:aspartate/glutamate racemase family protein n=1 Tax=Poseidonocella sp. HB161398 TaxID=2320855 RepID=UPI0011087C35|nr:aspartate/glutamate racemase family protein [Poseidonocella sp. HB161398]
MRILYLNPNSTAAMTESMVAEAALAVPGHEVIGWTNAAGPAAIQGAEDGAVVVPQLLSLLPAAEEAGAEAIVIGCFDDTGLEELRAAAHCPVIGVGQAAYHMAALRCGRFAVVTTLEVSVPVIESNLRAQGFAAACSGVIASGIPVLEVEEGSPRVLDRLAACMTGSGAPSVVLGCAGMARHAGVLAARTGMVLVDGVAAAARLSVALA